MNLKELEQKLETIEAKLQLERKNMASVVSRKVVAELKQKYELNASYVLRFNIEEEWKGLGRHSYYLEARLEEGRSYHSYHMSGFQEEDYHFSPSMQSTRKIDRAGYEAFLREILQVTIHADEIHLWIWYHPALLEQAHLIYSLEDDVRKAKEEIKNYNATAKLDFVKTYFVEHPVVILERGVSNRNGKFKWTKAITFKSYYKEFVKVIGDDGEVIVCDIDTLFKLFGGKEDGLV